MAADQGVRRWPVAERLGDEEVHRYLTDLRRAWRYCHRTRAGQG